jgi:hypothetical protein
VVTRIVGGGIFRKIQYLPLLAVSLAAYGLGLVMMAFAQSTPLLTAADHGRT